MVIVLQRRPYVASYKITSYSAVSICKWDPDYYTGKKAVKWIFEKNLKNPFSLRFGLAIENLD
jgi:hypothetical protein